MSEINPSCPKWAPDPQSPSMALPADLSMASCRHHRRQRKEGRAHLDQLRTKFPPPALLLATPQDPLDPTISMAR